MKYIFLAIFVLSVAQPLQASLSDMCDAQNTSHARHGAVNDVDCCEHDPTESSDSCDPISHCGTCTAVIVAVSTDRANAVSAVRSGQYLPAASAPLSRFNSPLFRPPIG